MSLNFIQTNSVATNINIKIFVEGDFWEKESYKGLIFLVTGFLESLN